MAGENYDTGPRMVRPLETEQGLPAYGAYSQSRHEDCYALFPLRQHINYTGCPTPWGALLRHTSFAVLGGTYARSRGGRCSRWLGCR